MSISSRLRYQAEKEQKIANRVLCRLGFHTAIRGKPLSHEWFRSPHYYRCLHCYHDLSAKEIEDATIIEVDYD